MLTTLFYWLILSELSGLSMRVSAYGLLCGQVRVVKQPGGATKAHELIMSHEWFSGHIFGLGFQTFSTTFFVSHIQHPTSKEHPSSAPCGGVGWIGTFFGLIGISDPDLCEFLKCLRAWQLGFLWTSQGSTFSVGTVVGDDLVKPAWVIRTGCPDSSWLERLPFLGGRGWGSEYLSHSRSSLKRHCKSYK